MSEIWLREEIVKGTLPAQRITNVRVDATAHFWSNPMMIVVSFDIDGTLEVGDPPGPITMELVRKAFDVGCTVGSCSDKTLATQERIWASAGIVRHFISMKHQLPLVRERFPADRYYHIGDRDIDERYAREAGFTYIFSDYAMVEALVTEAAELRTKHQQGSK